MQCKIESNTISFIQRLKKKKKSKSTPIFNQLGQKWPNSVGMMKHRQKMCGPGELSRLDNCLQE